MSNRTKGFLNLNRFKSAKAIKRWTKYREAARQRDMIKSRLDKSTAGHR